MKKYIITALVFLSAKTLMAQTNILAVQDTRAVATSPSSYAQSVESHFKSGTILGLPNTYYTVLGLRGWADDSGGKAHELTFADEGNVYIRSGYTSTGWGSWRSFLVSNDNGNFGIGLNTAPSEKLTINGNIKLADPLKGYLINYASLSESYGGASTILGNNVMSGTGSNTIKKLANPYDAGSFVSLNYYYGITFHTGINGALNVDQPVVDSEKMRITQSGNVGIGTITPTQKLSINGNLSFSGDNVNRYIITDATYTGTGKVTMQAGAGSAGFGGGINLYGHANGAKPGWVVAGISASAGATGTNTEGRFTVNDQGLGDGVDLFTVLRSGNVGIGATSPRAKLDISGNMLLQSALHNSSPRPPLSSQPIGGEIRSYSQLGYGADDGLLRLSAGAGTTSGIMSYIDISSYSTIPDMNQNIVFGTAGEEKMRITQSGNVGIGTTTPNEKLAVNGKIRAKEIKVETANWPDYVFADDYKVGTLEDLESYIKANKRLPEMPSAKEAEANGIELGELNKLLLKKVEELTLMLIDQNKKNEKQEQAIDELRKELEKVKNKK